MHHDRLRLVAWYTDRAICRAAVWLVVPASRSATPDITWNPDGTLSAPNALHIERRELVIPVEVR